MSSSSESASARSWACCSGESEFHMACGGGHALGQLLEQLVEGLRVAGEHVAVLLHELLEARVERLAPLALLEHLVEGVEGVAHARHLLGVMLESASDAPSK